MGRPRKVRKDRYKGYYNKGSDDDIPESTERYRNNKKARLDQAEAQDSCSDSAEEPPHVTQTSNLSFFSQSRESDLESSSSGSSSNNSYDESSEDSCCTSSHIEPIYDDADGIEQSANLDQPIIENNGEGNPPTTLCNNEVYPSSPSASSDDEDDPSSPSSSSEDSSSLPDSPDEDQGSRSDRQQEESDEDGERLDPYNRLKCYLNGNFGQPMNLNIQVSIGEVLTNALTLVRKHNWSHLEKENLMKFINSILNSGDILPKSRFLLDQLFYSKKDMTYHFYCSVCSMLLGAIPAHAERLNHIICTNPNCNTLNDLSDLSKTSYFVIFDLPSQMEVLLSDSQIRTKICNPIDFVNGAVNNVMHDLYHGSNYQMFARHVQKIATPNAKYISFTMSVDSASLCKFSGQSICPCFIMINELPTVLRMGNLLLAGLWFGKVKEKLDLFLPPIVNHITELSQQGFTLNLLCEEVWHMKGFLINCCADSVARCDIQGIHAHRGDFPCSWCLIEGEEHQNARIFRYSDPLPPPRTLQELLEDSREALRTETFVNGVKYLSPLAPAPLFHPVNGFIVDPMHSKDEGTTKSFLKAWLGENGETEYYIGSPANLKKINALIKQVKPPKELRKAVRNLEDLGHWTGRELENWAFFISVPVLVNILPRRYLMHWALYVQAIYLLHSSKISLQEVDIAEKLIDEFCSKVEVLYAPHMMRFNLHILRHFAENTRRHGPMFALSAYAFEAGNQTLKNFVHRVNYIPNQVCRGLSENNAYLLLKRHCENENTLAFERDIDRKLSASREKIVGNNMQLLGFGREFFATEEEMWFLNNMGKQESNFTQYCSVKKDGCIFETTGRRNRTRTDNSYARLVNKDIIQIKKILYCNISENVWVVGFKVRCEPSKYCPPSVIRMNQNLCFLFSVNSVDEDVTFFNASELDTICVSSFFEHGQYISPMPNIFNLF